VTCGSSFDPSTDSSGIGSSFNSRGSPGSLFFLALSFPRGAPRPFFFGGITCDALGGLTNTTECNNFECPLDCEFSSWSTWGTCSQTCGGGEMFKERKITHDAVFGGKECPHTREHRGCNMQGCPTHCEIGEWGAFGACSESCGNGEHMKLRNVTEGTLGGTVCPANTVNHITAACNTHACPVDCQLSGWSFYGACSEKCAGGNHSRTRVVMTTAKFGGAECGDVVEVKDCNTHPCCVEATYSAWSAFGTCGNAYNGKDCGQGTRTMTRSVTVNDTNCPARTENNAYNVSHTENCEMAGCVVNCVQSDWTVDPICRGNASFGHVGAPLNCGIGHRHRSRTITTHAEHGGTACLPNHELETCDTGKVCDVDCEMEPWDAQVWSACETTSWPLNEVQNCRDCSNVSSTSGMRTRTRTSTVDLVGAGAPCAPAIQHESCAEQCCAVDCTVAANETAQWTSCDKSCGTGQKTKTLEHTYGTFGGSNAACQLQHYYQKLSCNTHPCPIDCVMSEWGAWSSCDKTCGGGEKTRTRNVTIANGYGGEACPSAGENTDVGFCMDQACGGNHTEDQINVDDTNHTSHTGHNQTFELNQVNETQWHTDNMLDELTHLGGVNGESWQNNTAAPTAAPTSYPTVDHSQDKCMNGATEVDYGWHGAGANHDGVDNSCNLCKCARKSGSSDTGLHCQKKICADKVAFGNVCSHTKCHFIYNFEAQHKVMMVSTHHNEEEGSHHECAYSAATNGCVCRCASPLSTPAATLQAANALRMRGATVTYNGTYAADRVTTLDTVSDLVDHSTAAARPVCLDNVRRAENAPVIMGCLDKVTQESDWKGQAVKTRATW